jgi:hypothetical protein
MPSKLALYICVGLLTGGCGDSSTGAGVQGPGAAVPPGPRAVGPALLRGTESLLTADADPVDFRVLIGNRTMLTTPSDCDGVPCVLFDGDGRDGERVTSLVPTSQVAPRALDSRLSGLPVPALEEEPFGQLVLDELLHTVIDEMSALVLKHETMPGLTRQDWQPFEQPSAERVFHADGGRFR